MDVVVALLFGRGGVRASTTGGGRCGHGRRGSCGHAELLFELLQQFTELNNGELRNAVEDLFLGQCCSHGDAFLFFVSYFVDLVIRPVRSRRPLRTPRFQPRARQRVPPPRWLQRRARRRAPPPRLRLPRRVSRRRRSLPEQLPSTPAGVSAASSTGSAGATEPPLLSSRAERP